MISAPEDGMMRTRSLKPSEPESFNLFMDGQIQ